MKCPPRFLAFTLPVKILIYGSIRMIYPFQNFLVDDWGLTRDQMSYILAISEIAAIPGGFITPWADLHGNRIFAIIAFPVFVLAGGAMLLPPTFAGLAVCRIATQLAGIVYLIALQSTLLTMFESSPGWITGVSESSWALSMLLLIPILSALYSSFGWRAPFLFICAASFLLALEVYLDFPKDRRMKKFDRTESDPTPATEEGMDQQEQLNQLPQSPSSDRAVVHRFSFRPPENTLTVDAAALEKRRYGLVQPLLDGVHSFRNSRYWYCFVSPGPLLYNFAGVFYNISANLLFIGLTNWLTEVHTVNTSEMGGISFAVGVSELIGSGTVILVADRAGLFRGQLVAGFLTMIFTAIFLIAAKHSFIGGLVTGLLTNTLIEFMIVTQLAVPSLFLGEEHRTTLIGIYIQTHFVGRAVGALIAEKLWAWHELTAVCTVCICSVFICLIFTYFAEKFLPVRTVQSRPSMMIESNETSAQRSPEEPPLEEASSIQLV